MDNTPVPWKSIEDGIFGNNGTLICKFVMPENRDFICRAVNSHSELLEACKLAFENLKPRGDVKKDISGHIAMAALSTAIFKAEGK